MNASALRGRRWLVVAALAVLMLSGLMTAAVADEGHEHHDPYANCDDAHPETLAIRSRVQYALEHVYTDVAVMAAAGYHPYFDVLVPGGVSHWIKPQFIDDGIVLDPLRPESIIVDQWRRPVGIMFIENSWEPGPPVYVNEGSGLACSPWHPHTDMPARVGWKWYRSMYTGDTSTAIPAQTPAMMHVWAVDNPHGVYAAHDYPPESGCAPGPFPSYLKDGRVQAAVESVTCPEGG